MAKITDDKKTTSREALTCVAISYLADNPQGTLVEFSKIIRDFFFDDDKTEINKLKNRLSSEFSMQRVKEIFKDESKALAKSGSQNAYSLKTYKEDFPDGKGHASEDGGPTNLDAEIKSAYSTADILKSTPILGGLGQYTIFDQSSDFMKVVKDDSLNKTLTALALPSSIGSDILSSIDIMLVKTNKINQIKSDFEQHITGNHVDAMTILNNLAWGETGKNTFRTLTNKYFFDKDMVGISLKKVPANRKAKVKIVGSVSGARGDLHIYLDPYTEFLARVQNIEKNGTRTELFNLIDNMVEITDIGNTDPRAYFVVNYKLNYKKVNIAEEVDKINLQIGRSGFNAASSDQIAFVGGASYTVTLPILKKYPRYNQTVREVVSIREKAFKYAVDEKVAKKRLSSEYTKAMGAVKKNTLVLYDSPDNVVIKDFCKEYDRISETNKDSFQEYRIAVCKLCKNKQLSSPHGQLKDLDKDSFKTTGVPKTLHNDYVHSQGLWLYTRQGANLKQYFKKQISLTLYGLMSKKGARVFHSRKRGEFTQEAFVKEFKAKNNKTKLAKVIAAPFLLIS